MGSGASRASAVRSAGGPCGVCGTPIGPRRPARALEVRRAPEAGIAGLVRAAGARPDAFVLDTALRIEGLGRWTFAGADPASFIECRGGVTRVFRAGRWRRVPGPPLKALRRWLGAIPSGPPEPFPFPGGAVGFFSYDFGRRLVRIPALAREDTRFPGFRFAEFRAFVARDNRSGRTWACGYGPEGAGPALRLLAEARGARAGAFRARPLRWSLGRAAFMAGVRRIRAHIRDGQVYQVNLTRRLEGLREGAPAELFLRMRAETPAPFAALLQWGDRAIVSASPERFLSLRDGEVETRPIKGTRPRARGAARDRALARELLASAKDRAELAMIVDLERNDLGRSCAFGSITAPEIARIEAHPTVHHLVGIVRGRLRPDADRIDLLAAAFPGGSVTGAPKIRAMEIIEELEPVRRGPYTGAIGYFGRDGSMDLSVAIRIVAIEADRFYLHTGGGVTWDSDPAAEFRETEAKAAALLRALAGPGNGDP